jgi:aminoglycoside phosphotransferase (APT) family kinase protein
VLEDRPDDLDPWLGARLDELHDLARRTLPRLAGDAVVHTDLRADNLLVEPDGTVRVVDWPWASHGAPWFDPVALLVDVRWSGSRVDLGPHLARVGGLGATREDVLGTLSGLAGFLTDAARRPAPTGLPTVRAFQRAGAVAATGLLRELWP